MICPRCNSNLNISNSHDVEIDFCSNCRGVWLDRGELEKIIERSNSFSAPYYNEHDNHNQHDSHSGQQYGNSHYPRRKKSLFSDLFDF